MHALIRTARTTGLFYLGLAIAGVLGFVVIRSRLFAADDPAATLAHLVDNQSLARAGVALELLIVLTQALAAIWFYRLFRTADPLAASGIAAFGLVNAVTVLVSAALLATAVEVALDPIGDAATTVQLLYLLPHEEGAVSVTPLRGLGLCGSLEVPAGSRPRRGPACLLAGRGQRPAWLIGRWPAAAAWPAAGR
jgi:hypothetical protein